MTQPDPHVFMSQFTSWEVATKENKWQGRNITRWRNAAYDETYRAAEGELDPVKRAALFIRLNDLVCGDHAVIPIVYRLRVVANSLAGIATLEQTTWDEARETRRQASSRPH